MVESFEQLVMVNIFSNDYIIMIPEVYLLSIIIISLIIGVFFDKYIITLGQKVIVLLSKLGCIGLLCTLLLYYNQLELRGYFFNYKVIKDDFNFLFLILVILGSIIMLLLNIDFLSRDKLLTYEYIVLQLLSILGILVLIISNDFLILYLSIELQSLCFYIMVGFKQNSDFSTEAGLKYFIFGAVATGIFLLGISLFYGFVGLLNFTDIAYLYFEQSNIFLNPGIFFSIVCIFIGFFFKMGAAPFHVWLPDVYEGSSIMVTAFFAIVPKMGIIAVFLRLYYEIFSSICVEFSTIFMVISILSLYVGVFGSLVQYSIKRLMGYSAIAHTGIMLLGFVVCSDTGIFSVLFYIITYFFLTINFFSILLILRTVSDNALINVLRRFCNLYQINKGLAFAITIALFSMIGLPPFMGFYSKFFIFFSIIQAGYYLLLLLVILLISLSSVYYLKIILFTTINEDTTEIFLKQVPLFSAYIISYTTLLSIYFNFFGQTLFYMLNNIIINFFI